MSGPIYEPPVETSEVDPTSLRPSGWVTLVGLLQVFGGITTFAQGAQLLTMFSFRIGWMNDVGYLFLLLGVGQMVLGGMASTGRDRAAVGNFILFGFVQLVATGWWLILLGEALIVLTWFWVAFNAVVTALAGLIVPECIRVSRARRSLYADD